MATGIDRGAGPTDCRLVGHEARRRAGSAGGGGGMARRGGARPPVRACVALQRVLHLGEQQVGAGDTPGPRALLACRSQV